MAAVNLYPWVRNLNGTDKPLILPGKVQAGSTAAIKRGEICTFNETSGYFIPANAVADSQYSLAIANEEQKSTDLERYMEFIMLRKEDVFEITLAAGVDPQSVSVIVSLSTSGAACLLSTSATSSSSARNSKTRSAAAMVCCSTLEMLAI